MEFAYRTVTRILGYVLAIAGLSMLLPIAVAYHYSEHTQLHAFIAVALPCIFLGSLIVAAVKPSIKQLRLRDGFLIVSTSWLMVAAIAAIPLILDGTCNTYIDAFFEMCSGFSTTGATIFKDVESLSHATLMWRSFSHWLGGMGILLFAIALLPTLGISGQEIAQAETPGPILAKLTPKMSDTARDLYIIYIGMTALLIVLLLPSGIGPFDAITHAFSTVGTGGFSNYNDSIAHFHNPYVESVVCIFMIFAGYDFTLYFAVIRRKKASLLFDDEGIAYIKILIVASALIFGLGLFTGTFDEVGQAARGSLFHVSSILTTTGFVTSDFGIWPTSMIVILFALFFIGGCSSSTAGGPKVVRIQVMMRMIKQSILLKLHPNVYTEIKYNGKKLSMDTVQSICSFIFLYIFTLFFVSIFVSLDDFDMITSFSAAATCLANIGPGLGIVDPVSTFSAFSGYVKFVLSLAMICGRLELFTLLMLFSGKFWNPDE